MKFEQFFAPKTSDNSQKIESGHDKKEAAKNPGFFRNLKMAGVISLGMLAFSGEAFPQENNNDGKKDLKQKEFFTPTPSWNFVEGTDSVLAENNSKAYPGLVENYIKNEEGKYELYQYTDKDGNILETPDFLQKAIISEEKELAKYADTEEWAQKQFEYQKTIDFKTAVLQKYVVDIEGLIKELSGRLELFTDSATYSAEERKLDEQDIDKYKKSIAYFQEHPEELPAAKEKNIKELRQEAEGYINLIKNHIKDYQEKLDSVLKYIDRNKK